jgi:hypothetical protein
VRSARAEGYRARAAYKLLELDRRFGLLEPGAVVLDLGCAPGSWSQVAAARGCRVIGVDLLEVAPIAGATLLQGDLFDPATAARLYAAAGSPAAAVLSDMAAASIGQRAVDRLRAAAIGEAVLDLLPELLAPGGKARPSGPSCGCGSCAPRRPIRAPPRSIWSRPAIARPPALPHPPRRAPRPPHSCNAKKHKLNPYISVS